jgi:hypothetical protein
MENGSSPVAPLRCVMRHSHRNHTCDSPHWNAGGLPLGLLSEISRISAPSPDFLFSLQDDALCIFGVRHRREAYR